MRGNCRAGAFAGRHGQPRGEGDEVGERHEGDGAAIGGEAKQHDEGALTTKTPALDTPFEGAQRRSLHHCS